MLRIAILIATLATVATGRNAGAIVARFVQNSRLERAIISHARAASEVRS